MWVHLRSGSVCFSVCFFLLRGCLSFSFSASGTLTRLASALYTNCTTLSQTIQECRYENYTQFIKKLRIHDFMQQVGSGSSSNYQDTFFFVGFRSRNTALRNFSSIQAQRRQTILKEVSWRHTSVGYPVSIFEEMAWCRGCSNLSVASFQN